MHTKIEYAKLQKQHVFRLTGDIRYHHVLPLTELIHLLSSESIPFFLDLSDTELLDSSALGVMAIIAKQSKVGGLAKPKVYVSSKSIEAILKAVCFDKVFDIINEPIIPELVENHQFELNTLNLDVENTRPFEKVDKVLSDLRSTG